MREALIAAGIGDPKRSELAKLEGITAQLVERTAALCRDQGKTPGVTMLRIQDAVEARRARLRRARAKRGQGDPEARQRQRETHRRSRSVQAERAQADAIIARLDDDRLDRLRRQAIESKPVIVSRSWRAVEDVRTTRLWPLKLAVAQLAQEYSCEEPAQDGPLQTTEAPCPGSKDPGGD